MKQAFSFVILGATLGLAGCGGGGAGTFGGGLNAAEAVLASYTPVYATEPDDINPADEMDESVEGGPGATGVMAVATMFDGSPEFRSVKIRATADGTKLYVSVNGGAEIELDELPSGAYGTNPPFDEPLVSYIGVGNSAWLQYTKINGVIYDNGEGVVGIETPTDRLPSGPPVNYTGDVTLFSYNDTISRDDIVGVNGTFDMHVDYDAGTIAGTTGGTVTLALNGGGGVVYGASGQVVGNTDNGGLLGTMTFDTLGGDVSVTFAGKTYGWDAQEVGGAAIGSISGTADGTIPVYGWFQSD